MARLVLVGPISIAPYLSPKSSFLKDITLNIKRPRFGRIDQLYYQIYPTGGQPQYSVFQRIFFIPLVVNLNLKQNLNIQSIAKYFCKATGGQPQYSV